MGFPHPTLDIPGSWPIIADELTGLHIASDLSHELERGLQGNTIVVQGHICATSWVFSPRADFMVLVRHKTLGWSTPGGHVERHESTRIAGLRELEEETGLTTFDVRSVLDGPALVHVTDRIGDRPHRHWNVAWLYTCEMDAPLSTIEGARWFSTDDLPDGAPDLIETAALLRDVVITT